MTRMWLVSLEYGRPPTVHVQPSDKDTVPNGTNPVRFRTITARAAARRYIRNNLVTAIYVNDDGMNEPSDLRDPNASNRYRPREMLANAKRWTKCLGRPVIRIHKD